MTATLTHVAGARSVEYVYVFLIEGCEVAVTSHSNPEEIKALWTATGHGAMSADWLSGLMCEGTISTKIKLFDPKVETDSLTIKVLDPGDYLAGLTQSEALATAARTTLRYATPGDYLDANDTTVPVESTGAFDSSGAIYIGHERITYASKTGGGAPTFNTCTRGTLALFQTDGGTDFAYPHGGGTTIRDGGQQVEVYSAPRVWANRRCALYILHREGSTFEDPDDPLMLWAGRIKSISDEDGFVTFEVTGVAEQLDTLVFSSQFQASIREGAFFRNGGDISVLVYDISGSTRDAYPQTEFIPAGTWTHDEIASKISDHLHLAELAGSLASGWELGLDTIDGVGPRYRFRFVKGSADLATVSLPEIAWAMLGFTVDGDFLSTDGTSITPKPLNDDGTYMSLVADGPPLLQYMVLRPSNRIYTDDEEGTWVDQLNIPVESVYPGREFTVHGYMMIDGRYVCAVQNNGDTSYDIVQTGLGRLEAVAEAVPASGLAIRVTDDQGNRPIKIKQVWMEYCDVADAMLRLLLSTGTSGGGYNHADYDNLQGNGFGVGLPASLIDEDTWQGLGGTGYWMLLAKPQRFSEILESALEVRGAYLVWRRGKLAIARPGETAPGAATYQLTEANKADPGRTKYKRSNDSVVNVCKIKVNRTIDGRHLDEVTVKAAASISDIGERKPVTLETIGVYDGLLGPGGGLDESIATVSQILGYFSRPACEVTRSYAHTVMGIAAGDTVDLTDERVIDPTTGERGVSNWPCWVSETRWDLARGAGECALIFLPEFHKDQRALWAPSAEVSSSSVASSRLTVTCVAHRYSSSSDATTDAGYMAASGAGSKYRVVEVSPASSGSPTSYTGLVLHSSGTNTLTFTTDPTAGVGLSTSKLWVVEYEDYSTVISLQQSGFSYVCNSVTRQIIGVAESFVRVWLGWVPFAGDAVSYTNLYRKLVDLASTDGEPNSVHWFVDAANSLNTIWSTKRQLLLSEMFDTDRTATTEAWIAGPIYIPLYGYNRDLGMRARCACSGGGTVTVKFIMSTGRPVGASATSLTFPDGALVYATVTRTSGTQGFTSEGTITNPDRVKDGRLSGAWVTVMASSSAGTATVTGIEIFEKAIT